MNGAVVVPNAQAESFESSDFINAIAPTPTLTAKQAGIPETLRYTDKNDLGPRLGFAWRVRGDDKTVLRGGWGRFIETPLGFSLVSGWAVHASFVGVFNPDYPNPRVASELAGASMSAAGVNVSVVRLPQVHDTVKQGLVTYAVALAREKGVSAYVGDGTNRYAAAHVLDVARLYRLALERRQAGARYHAVDEEGVQVRSIAEVIGQGLNVPVASLSPDAAADHFGWLAAFVGLDLVGSSALTRERLGWRPTGPGLLTDLRGMRYS